MSTNSIKIAQSIESSKGKQKINIDGYLYWKDKNRDDMFYWICEKKGSKCVGRATTLFLNGQHIIRNHDSAVHNHGPDACKPEALKACNKMKALAIATNDLPVQIISNVLVKTSTSTQPNLPSKNALRQQIKRISRRNLPAEPSSLLGFTIPDEFKKTISGYEFFHDIRFESDRILLFTTENNLKWLSSSRFWIMDGTFNTVPVLFRQLYTIHASVGGVNNSEIVPLIYALMTSKSEELYQKLFQELNDLAQEYDIEMKPEFILTDFEKASINAIKSEFPSSQNKGCFFHLGQCLFRKIQECGLTVQYGTDENFCLLMKQIPALAFLSYLEIPEAFDELKNILPAEAEPITAYFEENFVHGRIKKILCNGHIIRYEPFYPPIMWSVYENVEFGMPRTQNKVEAWHRRWKSLVGRSHVGIFKMLSEILKEQNDVEMKIEKSIRGEPIPKKRKKDITQELRLQNILSDRMNRSTLEFLRGIAHNIAL